MTTIALLPGDGIGPEVIHEARRALEAVGGAFGHRFEFDEALIGGAAIDATGDPLPMATIDACQGADAILLGAVGGPKWDDPQARVRPEQGLLNIRRGLGLFSNLRPVKAYPALADVSPLKADRVAGVDMLVVRELTGGIYFGAPRFRETTDGVRRAVDTMEYTDAEVKRVARMAFKLAQGRRRRLTSVDKSNVLESSRLWRQVIDEVSCDFPDVTVEHRLVDSAAMRLIWQADSFDVIVTSNMFGDILTDEASVLCGSLGLLPSASLGESGPGLFEPVHGSAPDIAGQGIANPVGAILSVSMLLNYSLGLHTEAKALEAAVEGAIAGGARTRDLGGELTTRQMGDRIIEGLA